MERLSQNSLTINNSQKANETQETQIRIHIRIESQQRGKAHEHYFPNTRNIPIDTQRTHQVHDQPVPKTMTQ